ncbi:hypothetical protein VTG60DRAFT_2089 [Thermothelomyces hinnuleus]
MTDAFAENSFDLATPDSARAPRPPAHGLFLLHSRFNHSCIPNANVLTPDGDVIESFAIRDIDPGEEITVCYEADFECRTRDERHQALRFACDCPACRPGTLFQQLSDARRRLHRGLEYLSHGVEMDRRRRPPKSPLIVDPQLKRAAETFDIPISSRLVYAILSVALLQEEGLLDDFKVKRVIPGISTLVGLFRNKENAEIARFAMVQDSWIKRLEVAFGLFGRKDAFDRELTKALRLRHKRSLLSVDPCNHHL